MQEGDIEFEPESDDVEEEEESEEGGHWLTLSSATFAQDKLPCSVFSASISSLQRLANTLHLPNAQESGNGRFIPKPQSSDSAFCQVHLSTVTVNRRVCKLIW